MFIESRMYTHGEQKQDENNWSLDVLLNWLLLDSSFFWVKNEGKTKQKWILNFCVLFCVFFFCVSKMRPKRNVWETKATNTSTSFDFRDPNEYACRCVCQTKRPNDKWNEPFFVWTMHGKKTMLWRTREREKERRSIASQPTVRPKDTHTHTPRLHMHTERYKRRSRRQCERAFVWVLKQWCCRLLLPSFHSFIRSFVRLLLCRFRSLRPI